MEQYNENSLPMTDSFFEYQNNEKNGSEKKLKNSGEKFEKFDILEINPMNGFVLDEPVHEFKKAPSPDVPVQYPGM